MAVELVACVEVEVMATAAKVEAREVEALSAALPVLDRSCTLYTRTGSCASEVGRVIRTEHVATEQAVGSNLAYQLFAGSFAHHDEHDS